MTTPKIQSDTTTTTRRFLTAAELMTQTGLSSSTIERLIHRRVIVPIQLAGRGGKRLFPLDAIEKAQALSVTNAASVVLKPGETPQAAPPRSGPRPRWCR